MFTKLRSVFSKTLMLSYSIVTFSCLSATTEPVAMPLDSASFSCNLHGTASYSSFDCFGVPLDHKLLQILNASHGIFIEVGANDGVTQSNTKLLEEYYNWTGILIEPSASLFSRLCGNRPNARCFECALGRFDQNNTYIYGDFDGNLMGSVDGIRLNNNPFQKTIIRSLQSILDEVGISHVNFFSLDCEGYEFNILQGIDFTKTSFDYLLIEIYNVDYENIISFLSNKGYDMIECLSNYHPSTNPFWDGTHNDYLFKKRIGS